MMQFPSLSDWSIKSGYPYIIAGPCSAETEEQVMTTAKELSKLNVHLFRSGIWKPRTRPHSFDGVGETGLKWLQQVRQDYQLPVTVEVVNTRHVELALKYNIDVLWIGARTTVSPFSVQAIADALDGIDIPVLVKNPVNPDIELWIGAIERLQHVGIKNIAAVHRGFSTFEKTTYRNKPTWEIPIELKRRFPDLPLLCDPSHICGRRELLQNVAQKALDLSFEGLMIEVHPEPEKALSDSMQQLTPAAFAGLLEQLVNRKKEFNNSVTPTLEELRTIIDKIDEQLFDNIAERMKYAEQIGLFKKENDIAIYQPERWNTIINHVKFLASEKNLSEDLMLKIFDCIHKESIRKQSEVMYDKKDKVEDGN